MLLEELFHSLLERSHAPKPGQPAEGELILRRLKELADPAQPENGTEADSSDDCFQKTTYSGSN